MAANASKHSAMSLQRIIALMAKYEEESKRLLELANQTDNTPTGLDIPAELSRREEMQLKLAHAKAVIEERQRQAYEHKKAEYDTKMEQRRAKEKLTGRKAGGKVPAAPVEECDPKAKFNFTDSESRVMKTKDGYGHCFNAQLAILLQKIFLSRYRACYGLVTQTFATKLHIAGWAQTSFSPPGC